MGPRCHVILSHGQSEDGGGGGGCNARKPESRGTGVRCSRGRAAGAAATSGGYLTGLDGRRAGVREGGAGGLDLEGLRLGINL